MERRKLQVATSDKVTNDEIRKPTNMKDMVAVAHSIKWNWGDHVAGMERRRRTQATSVWDVGLGKREPGDRRHVQDSSRRRVITNSQHAEHTTLVKSMSETPQT